MSNSDSTLFSFNLEQKLNEDNVYLICRGTRNKQNLIAKQFNTINTDITHVGVGIFENEILKIYNISIDKTVNNSSLIVETLSDFINVHDIFTIEIWATNTTSEETFKIKSILNNYIEKNIGFDFKFDLHDNENFYCSEFAAKILNKLNTFKYNFTKKEANKIMMRIIKNHVFEYFPVDFFLQNPNVIQVYKNNLP